MQNGGKIGKGGRRLSFCYKAGPCDLGPACNEPVPGLMLVPRARQPETEHGHAVCNRGVNSRVRRA
jgi:hypothetical protein